MFIVRQPIILQWSWFAVMYKQRTDILLSGEMILPRDTVINGDRITPSRVHTSIFAGVFAHFRHMRLEA